MKKILLIIPLLALISSCVDTEKAKARIDSIKEAHIEKDMELRQLVDSLRSITETVEDSTLYNVLDELADEMEYTLDDCGLEGTLDDFKMECLTQ